MFEERFNNKNVNLINNTNITKCDEEAPLLVINSTICKAKRKPSDIEVMAPSQKYNLDIVFVFRVGYDLPTYQQVFLNKSKIISNRYKGRDDIIILTAVKNSAIVLEKAGSTVLGWQLT